MQYRKFGKTGLDISLLGYGCMRLPMQEGQKGKIDEEKATEQIRYAIDNGVNYIDTAYPYHGGESELVVGRALKDGYREKIYLATKLPSWLIKTREDMDKYLNEQLEKLQTDHIDFYLLHALSKDRWQTYKDNGVFDFIDKAKETGKIKHIGFSFHDDLDVFKQIIDEYDGWEFCQIQFNYMDEYFQAGIEGLNYASDKGIPVIAMEPLRGGALTKTIPEDIQKVWDRADKKRTAAEWAFRFVFDYPNINVVLSGMNSIQQIEENIRTAEEGLPNSLKEEEKQLIDEVKKMYRSKIKVDCTKCQYCMPCPVGVNIPYNFELLNNVTMYDDLASSKMRYNNLMKPEDRAEACVQCGKCEKVCPQNISIRVMLKETVAILK
ncbi:aldo/keto reductase [Clostridium sp. DL1XJH146]